MGQKQLVRSVARAVVENMEARRLMSASATEFVLGADPNFADSAFPNLGQEEQLASNDAGAWAFAYTDAATKTVKVNTSGGAVLTLGSNVVGIPEVDSSADGKLVVSWGEQFTVKNATNYAVRAAVMAFPTGSSAPTVRTLTVATAKGNTPDVTGVTVGRANVVASYRYFPSGATTNVAVVQRVSLSSGAASAAVTAAHAMSVETNPLDDGYVTVWHDNQSNGNVYAQRYDKAGVKVGGQVNVAADPAVHETHGNVDVDAGGNYVVSLRYGGANTSATVAAAQVVAANGALGPRVTVAAGSPREPDAAGTGTTETSVQAAPSVDVSPDGSFVAQWSEKLVEATPFVHTTTTTSVLMQRFAADGTAAGGERTVASAIGENHYDAATGTWTPSGDLSVVSEEIVSLGGSQYLGTFSRRPQNSSTLSAGFRYGDVLTDPAPAPSGETSITEEPLPASL